MGRILTKLNKNKIRDAKAMDVKSFLLNSLCENLSKNHKHRTEVNSSKLYCLSPIEQVLKTGDVINITVPRTAK